MIRYEDTDPWYVKHGAFLGALFCLVVMLGLFAWGMCM